MDNAKTAVLDNFVT